MNLVFLLFEIVKGNSRCTIERQVRIVSKSVSKSKKRRKICDSRCPVFIYNLQSCNHDYIVLTPAKPRYSGTPQSSNIERAIKLPFEHSCLACKQPTPSLYQCRALNSLSHTHTCDPTIARQYALHTSVALCKISLRQHKASSHNWVKIVFPRAPSMQSQQVGITGSLCSQRRAAGVVRNHACIHAYNFPL